MALHFRWSSVTEYPPVGHPSPVAFKGPHTVHGWTAVLVACVAMRGHDVSHLVVGVDTPASRHPCISFSIGTVFNRGVPMGKGLIDAAKQLAVPFRVTVLMCDCELTYDAAPTS
jgi:hypothetical protein